MLYSILIKKQQEDSKTDKIKERFNRENEKEGTSVRSCGSNKHANDKADERVPI